MHTYEKSRTDEARELSTARIRSAHDVADWARTDHLIGRATRPDVWHLDKHGVPICFTNTSSACGIVSWAEDPYPLLRSRTEGLIEGACEDDWLIIESRPRWMGGTTSHIETVDAEAFIEVERVLDEIGVRLVDAVVFDDERHWWSLREVTKGTTQW